MFCADTRTLSLSLLITASPSGRGRPWEECCPNLEPLQPLLREHPRVSRKCGSRRSRSLNRSTKGCVQEGMGHARVPLVSTALFPVLLAIQEPDPNKQISHRLWFQWQARMPSDSLIECTLQDRIEVGWLRHEFYPRGHSPHNPSYCKYYCGAKHRRIERSLGLPCCPRFVLPRYTAFSVQEL